MDIFDTYKGYFPLSESNCLCFKLLALPAIIKTTYVKVGGS